MSLEDVASCFLYLSLVATQGSTFPLCINHNVKKSVTTVNKHNYI